MSSTAAARTTGSGGANNKFYPPPLAYHEDIVNDAMLFLDILRQFHFNMGSKYMIPVIGRRRLDLHTLYVEVTRRNGYEKVVTEKKWREVGSVFNFSPTTTSASSVLKKHYWNLLYDFEQVHFFKVRGAITPRADALSGSNSSGKPDLALGEYAPKHANNGPESNVEAKGYPRYGEGTIEGKFDCGYLVSVKLGSEVLRGVIFHPEEMVPPSSVQQDAGAIVPFDPKARRSGRRRRNRRRWDPNYPKPNRSGYNFFFAEKHTELKELYPTREREFTKMIGQSWNNLSPDEKMVYQNIGLMDKERYKRELAEYKERMKLRQPEEVERPQ